MKKTLVLLTYLAVSGCASMAYQYNLPLAKTENFIAPEIDEVVTIEVGEAMISSGRRTTFGFLSVPHEVAITDDAVKVPFSFVIPAGDYMMLEESNGKTHYSTTTRNELYAVSRSMNSIVLFGVADESARLVFDETTKSLCVLTRLSNKYCTKANDVKVNTFTQSSPTSFQQTLIYNGRIGNQIALGYREFKEDMARPAFSNDPVYDLNASKVVGYKGARIEVIKATNSSITYKVLSGFK